MLEFTKVEKQMQEVLRNIDFVPTVFDFGPLTLTDEQFESLARNHPDLNIELSAVGELILVAPTLPFTSNQNADLVYFLTDWSRKDKTGMVFDSNALFTFPNGAKRAPDAAWVQKEKWDGLSEAEKRKFSRLVPDFVMELRSTSDDLKPLKEKMAEYISNGVRLAWLIDPSKKRVHVYRANGTVEILADPEMVSGEDVLQGFELPIREIW